MAQKLRVLFLGVCLVISALGLVGCDHEGEEDVSLIGTWSSGSDGYVISNTTLTYEGYKDPDHPEWEDYSYTGTIKNNPDFTQKAGVIIIEYTKKPIYGQYASEEPYALEGGEAPTNSFMGIYWRELTTSSVELANASSYPDETETATLDEAKAKFTQEKAGDLVTWAQVQPQTKTVNNTSTLVGVWSSGSDGYVISNTTVTYEGYKDPDHPEWSDYSYTGTIKNNPDFTQKAGVIIIEYTKKPIYGQYASEEPYALEGGEAPTNSFMGIYWRELTASSVQLANAYDPEGTETETDSLDNATQKFTQEKAGDLVTWAQVQPQTKQ